MSIQLHMKPSNPAFTQSQYEIQTQAFCLAFSDLAMTICYVANTSVNSNYPPVAPYTHKIYPSPQQYLSGIYFNILCPVQVFQRCWSRPSIWLRRCAHSQKFLASQES